MNNEEKMQNENDKIFEMLKNAGFNEQDLEEMAREIIEGEEEVKEGYVNPNTGEVIEEEEDIIKLDETPSKQVSEGKKYAGIFDSVEKLEQAYKNLQAEYTKERQKIKPFEQFIELLQNNPEFAKFILEKSQEFFFKGSRKQKEEKEEEEDWDWDLEEKEEKKMGTLSRDEVINLIRNEINQVLTAQNLINEFKAKYPEVSDEELVQIINHARNFGGDLETSYLVLFKDKYKEKLKREIIEELKGRKSLNTASTATTSQPTSQGGVATSEKDIWRLAVEVANRPEKLKELDPQTRYMLLNILARQIL